MKYTTSLYQFLLLLQRINWKSLLFCKLIIHNTLSHRWPRAAVYGSNPYMFQIMVYVIPNSVFCDSLHLLHNKTVRYLAKFIKSCFCNIFLWEPFIENLIIANFTWFDLIQFDSFYYYDYILLDFSYLFKHCWIHHISLE